MHLKPLTEHLKQEPKAMASLNDDDTSHGRASNSSHNHHHHNNNNNNNNSNNNNNARTAHNNNNNNNNNNNENDNNSLNTQAPTDDSEIKLKKQTLEQRKQELERLLSEKSWLLQQIQKQETQILNGNYEYLNLNEIFANLAQQYKQEQQQLAGGSTAILRRKVSSTSKEHSAFNNNNNNNRQSEISNRSSEYDNYPVVSEGGETNSIGSGGGVSGMSGLSGVSGLLESSAAQQQQPPHKSALKKRSSSSAAAANLNYIQLQRQQLLQQHVEQQMLQQHIQYAAAAAVAQHQQQKLMHAHYYQQQQQRQVLSPKHVQSQAPTPQIDAISLYSVNSANVATLRQPHISPQQQPIVVQCDKYYLSPTHQSYNDGGFIKSSQNIKKYVSPMGSPSAQPHMPSTSYEQQLHTQHQPPQHAQQQHVLQPHMLYHQQRPYDAISLAPSYVSVDNELSHNLRWRSQSNLPQHVAPTHGLHSAPDAKSHSSDMLAQLPAQMPPGINYYNKHPSASSLKAKPHDEISISSLNSETAPHHQHKQRSKSKQWLESSLDSPVVRNTAATAATTEIHNAEAPPATFTRLAQKSAHHHPHARERNKLSSQSMSSGRHYSMSAQKHAPGPKLLQHDDGRYAKLSQSTSYLNSIEAAGSSSSTSAPNAVQAIIDIPPFKYLPPKPSSMQQQQQQQLQQPTPPPRPPPSNAHPNNSHAINSDKPLAVAPDIRIESPKNMTVVQQATFQPYKEVTKPFEMSDFYKYSTKYRQKEPTGTHAGD